MHKDIFIYLPEHEQKAKRILDIFLEQSRANSYEGIICIGGISGTGKSEVAWFLSRQLYKMGISSHIVNMDRFYIIPPERRNAHRKQDGIIGKDEIDWERIEEEKRIFDNNDIRVLIFEGLYAGYIDGMTFLLRGNTKDTDEFRHLRGKEDEDDPFRQYVVGEEYSSVLGAIYEHEI